MVRNKIAFISGASAGIGEATARKLASEGYSLILNARREDRLAALKKELESTWNVEVMLSIFDVRMRDDVATAIAAIPAEWKDHICLLINNAGLASGLASI